VEKPGNFTSYLLGRCGSASVGVFYCHARHDTGLANYLIQSLENNFTE